MIVIVRSGYCDIHIVTLFIVARDSIIIWQLYCETAFEIAMFSELLNYF